MKANRRGTVSQRRKCEIRTAGSFTSALCGDGSDQKLRPHQLASIYRLEAVLSAIKNDDTLHEGRVNRNSRTVLYYYKWMITPGVLPC